mmetsp:Transcript_11105/g.16666  ORF Transcript_11105/g.16666 Transcript_11105/m.16666 type:complete len:83 (+) Transcript_11105:500-748(+)
MVFISLSHFQCFFRIDEAFSHCQGEKQLKKLHKSDRTQLSGGETPWTLSQTFLDAMAACMIVTIFLDLVRLFWVSFGGLPWL